jgi:hypothetical protein
MAYTAPEMSLDPGLVMHRYLVMFATFFEKPEPPAAPIFVESLTYIPSTAEIYRSYALC